MPALEGVRRLLVIRHRAGGDLLLTTPALHALRVALPAASIEVLISSGLGGLLDGNPDVDRVLEFDRRSLGSQGALYARLRRAYKKDGSGPGWHRCRRGLCKARGQEIREEWRLAGIYDSDTRNRNRWRLAPPADVL